MDNAVQPQPVEQVSAALKNASKDTKLGLVFGGIGSLFILVGIVPIVGCFFSWLHWFVSLFGGFTTGAIHNSNQNDLVGAVKASLKPGLIAATILTVTNVVVGIISAILFPATIFTGLYTLGTPSFTYYIPGIILGAIFVFFFTVLSYAIGAVVAAFVNAGKLSWMENVTKFFK